MDQASGDRHRYFEGLAVSHVLGGLSESDGRVFRSHLLDCSQCRARVGELRRIANDLADVERDERRVKAAKAIETKRRESDDDDGDFDDAGADQRRSRVMVLIGLLVVLALAGWNFYLRADNGGLRDNVQALEVTRDLLVGGEYGTYRSPTGEFTGRATVRYDEEFALVVLDGVDRVDEFVVYQTNEQDEVIEQGRRTVRGDRLTLLLPRARDSHHVFLTILDEGEQPRSQEITGAHALVATLG